MVYTTGPPDPQDIVTGLVFISLLYLSVFPFVYIADELSPSQVAVHSVYLK